MGVMDLREDSSKKIATKVIARTAVQGNRLADLFEDRMLGEVLLVHKGF